MKALKYVVAIVFTLLLMSQGTITKRHNQTFKSDIPPISAKVVTRYEAEPESITELVNLGTHHIFSLMVKGKVTNKTYYTFIMVPPLKLSSNAVVKIKMPWEPVIWEVNYLFTRFKVETKLRVVGGEYFLPENK